MKNQKTNKRDGQTLLEFALILPIALLVIAGLVVFGQIMNAFLTLNNATREAARAGIVGATNMEVQMVLRDRLYTLDRSHLTISIDPEQDTQRRVGDPLKVEARYEVPLWMPIYNMVLPNPFPLKSVTTMRIEGLPGLRELPPPEDGGDDDHSWCPCICPRDERCTDPCLDWDTGKICQGCIDTGNVPLDWIERRNRLFPNR